MGEAYRPSFGLTAGEWALLKYLEDGAFRGHGYLCAKSKERDRLKRLGLIVSAPTNPRGTHAISGKAKRWLPTGEGRKALDWYNRTEETP